MKQWEDCEEPKDIWWLDNEGNINHNTSEVDNSFEKNREIGNYFSSREEAEQAVRKLKAWKRLKDKGFRFVRIDEQNEGHRVGQYIEFEIAYHFTPNAKQIGDDLVLLFGGGE